MSVSELRSGFNSSSSRHIWVGWPITSHMAETGDSHCMAGVTIFFPLFVVFVAVITDFAMGTSFAGVVSTVS